MHGVLSANPRCQPDAWRQGAASSSIPSQAIGAHIWHRALRVEHDWCNGHFAGPEIRQARRPWQCGMRGRHGHRHLSAHPLNARPVTVLEGSAHQLGHEFAQEGSNHDGDTQVHSGARCSRLQAPGDSERRRRARNGLSSSSTYGVRTACRWCQSAWLHPTTSRGSYWWRNSRTRAGAGARDIYRGRTIGARADMHHVRRASGVYRL